MVAWYLPIVVAAGGIVLARAATPAPGIVVPCGSIAPASEGDSEAGGRFQLASTDSDCSIHGLTGGAPLCLAISQPDDFSIVVHSQSYSKQDHLGGWAVKAAGSGAVAFVRDDGRCLTAGPGGLLTASACASAVGPSQAFVVDTSASLLRLASDTTQCVAWGSPPPVPGRYVVGTGSSSERQTIWGFGFEIQSDSIGSDNNGLPNSTSSVPHDLIPSERTRFFGTMLRGFRYCRLALGLFLRGLTPDRRNLQGRWPTQMAELKALQDGSGIEGFDAEYWSPPPAWKSTQSWLGGSLASFNASWLDTFGDSVVKDLRFLEASGLRTTWFGLQNEPNFDRTIVDPSACQNSAGAREISAANSVTADTGSLRDDYSVCRYSQCQYYQAFRAVAPKLKAAFPKLRIHANSATGQAGASPIALDPQLRANVDGWTWHMVGADSSRVFSGTTVTNMSFGLPVWSNEFEYQPSQFRGNRSTANTAAFVMNWLTFAQSPTFYWIHALKPSTNEESIGYGLGIWRPPTDTNFSRWPDIQPGHWAFNGYNWNAMAPFARFVPWDSTRLAVHEDVVREDQRVFAFRTPSDPSKGGPLHAGQTPPGAVGFALVNKHPSLPFEATFTLESGATTMWGHRFTATANDTLLGSQTGAVFNVTVPPLAAEWWLQWN